MCATCLAHLTLPPSSGQNSWSASQQIPCILWNMNTHYLQLFFFWVYMPRGRCVFLTLQTPISIQACQTVTLKMETGNSSETLEHTSTTQHINPNKDHQIK
jgi:hypothetical protein